jgi:NitT/TauT family transport system substrate-binding protein
MLRRQIVMRLFWVWVAAAGLMACSHGGSGPAPREVRVSLSVDPITWLPIRLAQSLGYAAQEGISITVSQAAGLSKGMEALVGGSADVTPGGLNEAMLVATQGRAVRCFLVMYTRPPTALVVAPRMAEKIRAVVDLKGRRVGVTSPGSGSHQFLNFLLASHGLSPSDVSIVSVGTGASSIAALDHGLVEAAVLVANGINAFERRYPKAAILADLRTEEGTRQVFGVTNVAMSALDAREEWLRANPETVRHFVRAVKKGMEWMANHSAEEVRATIPEGSRMPDVDADLDAIRQAQRTLSPDGIMPPGVPEITRKYLAVSDENVRSAHLDLSRLYTNEFVRGN